MTFDLRDNYDSEDNYPPGDKVTDTVYRRFHNSLCNSGRTVRTGIELVPFWGAGPRVVALAKPGESSPFIASRTALGDRRPATGLWRIVRYDRNLGGRLWAPTHLMTNFVTKVPPWNRLVPGGLTLLACSDRGIRYPLAGHMPAMINHVHPGVPTAVDRYALGTLKWDDRR